MGTLVTDHLPSHPFHKGLYYPPCALHLVLLNPAFFALVPYYLGSDIYPCSAGLLFDSDAVAHAEIGRPLSVYQFERGLDFAFFRVGIQDKEIVLSHDVQRLLENVVSGLSVPEDIRDRRCGGTNTC